MLCMFHEGVDGMRGWMGCRDGTRLSVTAEFAMPPVAARGIRGIRPHCRAVR